MPYLSNNALGFGAKISDIYLSPTNVFFAQFTSYRHTSPNNGILVTRH